MTRSLSMFFLLFDELFHFRVMLECRYSLHLVLFPSMVSLDYQMESKQLELYHFVLEKTRDPLDCGMDDIQPFDSSVTVMLVTSSCWWLKVGDNFRMLVTKS